jgi:hypothetical protein
MSGDQKLRWRNFPTWLIKPVIIVAQLGEQKYGLLDYLKKDYTVNDHLDALKRHLEEFENPLRPDLDHETKEWHL